MSGTTAMLRSRVLVIVGAALLLTGTYSSAVLLYSSLARYMYIEDLGLGLEDRTMHEITKLTPTEVGFIVFGAMLSALGILLLVVTLVVASRHRRRASFQSA